MNFRRPFLLLLPLLFSIAAESFASQTLILGVFSYRPKPIMIERYQPLVDYLNLQLKDTQIKLQVLELSEINTVLDNKSIDLLLTNPRHNMILSNKHKLTGAIATLVKKSSNGRYTQNLGGVIFTSKNNRLINELKDLKGRRIAFPGTKFMGGYQSQAYELLQVGIKPDKDITLIESGGHDEVVKRVLSGQLDAGFVRTEILEDLAAEGKLALTQIKVINRKFYHNFPFIVSTRLYPEWPFAALAHVERRLVSRISSALMALDEHHPAALAAGIAGFSPPADYRVVEKIARELHLPPYDQMTKITWSEIWNQNKVFIFFVVFSLAFIAFLLWLLAYRNHQLKENEEELMYALASQDAILSAIPELMFELDIEGRYLNVWARNPGELTASRSMLLGRTVSEIMPENAAKIVLAVLKEAKRTGYSHGQQIHLTTVEGDMWFELSTSLKSWQGGSPRFIMLLRDISYQKESERKLIVSQDRFRGLFENMADGVAIYQAVDDGEDFEFIDFNQAGENIDGTKRKDLLGRKVTDVFPGIRKMGLLDVLQRVWHSGVAESFPVSFYSDKNLKGWRDNFVYRLDSGEIVAIYSDETARKLAEQKLQDSEYQKKQILHTVPELMWLKDVDGIYMACNSLFEQFCGLKEEELIGKTDFDFVDAAQAEFFREHDKAAMQADKALVNKEWIIFAADGHKALIETTRIPFKTDNNKTIGVLGVGHDITQRYHAEEAQRLASSVFKHSQEGILVTDMDNRIIDVNPAFFTLTGFTREELIGQNPKVLSSGSHTKEFYAKMWGSINEQGNWLGEVINRKKSGELFTERLSIDAVKDEKGELQHYVGVFSDISYLKKQELELERVAYSDALTGLPNRLLLHDRMQQAINQAERHKKMVAVCYLDLDGFKPINDQFGHKAGDEVLVEVASRLQKILRNEDSVARLGGDEFVLIMLNLHSVFELEQLVERVLHIVAEPYILLSGQSVAVSASIGIALYPLDESEPDTLLRHADQAMYTAKKRGKNQFSFFDSNEERRAVVTQGLQNQIAKALQNDEFKLFYQPKINMRSGEIIGAEALIRWDHPDKGILSPNEFLPVIEYSSLAVELGNWVLREALTQLKHWLDSGLLVNVSVNIAALQLKQADFVSSLKSLLAEFPDVKPQQLELEILETTALHDIEHVSETMRQCAQMGIQFALDDFGTGYSSLIYLKQLPAQVLKIDQSFICDLLDNPDDVAITEGILGLTRAFGRTPIAEGVETVRHGSLLLSMGCELGQGYGIARPMPADDFPAWVKDFDGVSEWKQIRQLDRTDQDIPLLMMAVEHHRLVSQVLIAIKSKVPSLLPDSLSDAHSCNLGIWLAAEGKQTYGDLEEYQQIIQNHQKVHDYCKLAADQLMSGEAEKLIETSAKLKQLRNTVLDSLNSLR